MDGGDTELCLMCGLVLVALNIYFVLPGTY
jgi:hypothetical protein